MSEKMYVMRAVTEKDYEFIYLVKKNAYKKYVEMNFGEWEENQQKEFFEKFMEAYKEGAYIIQYEGTDIGFFNGCVFEDKYEIGNICIFEEYQNRGIGTTILKDILKEHTGVDVTLQYFKQNPVGRLYERLGFERVGETPYHYQMIFRRDRK